MTNLHLKGFSVINGQAPDIASQPKAGVGKIEF